MEIFKIENLSFAYPKRETNVLENINITIKKGEFVTLCGKSGCGKTTLLRLLKPSLSPHGEISGNIYFKDSPLSSCKTKEQASEIGFVMQSPDNQIVTDKVWHELAFGLESLGLSTPEIRTKVSEMASFFGIQNWFYKNVTELSGGQKQILNLASVMVMQPSVLILDEPTSQLDPISAQEFLKTLEKINRELGTTVILTEHRLEEAFPISDRIIVMDDGKIIADDTPPNVCEILKNINHNMYSAIPAPARIYGALEAQGKCPLTVRDGRKWLEEYSLNNRPNSDLIPVTPSADAPDDSAIEIKDAWFRFEKNLPDVIKGLNLKVNKGELYAIVGGNGSGKTTALSLISGLNTPYRGEVLINGKTVSKISDLYNGILGVLPQNPQSVFVKKTVYFDLLDILEERKLSKEEKDERIQTISSLCHINNLLERHPYDLSGGEQQRAALAKILLMSTKILLLDEPTKGMDSHFKKQFAEILRNLTSTGVTVIMVSHDIEFCAEYAHRCALIFDGSITSSGTPREFFAGNNFYTTSTNRMARTILPKAILAEDIILAYGGTIPKSEISIQGTNLPLEECKQEFPMKKSQKPSPAKVITGILLGILFLLTSISFLTDWDILHLYKITWLDNNTLQIITILEFAGTLLCFIPKRKYKIETVQQPRNKRKLPKRTLISALLILLAIPLTIYIGIYFLGDKKYYFISLLIILETIIPFFMMFEGRKPTARELVVISVLCAIAVAGRTAFFMLPQFKPVLALIIITGVCLGGETGFLVGAVTGFVSNFYFGQGPWTPWQMFAFGMVGFVAGILFKKGFLRKTKTSLSIFGFLAVFTIYGVISNSSMVIQTQPNPTIEMFVAACISGIPFDLVHAISTAFFLWFISEPMTDKLERIKIKYGLIDK